MEKRETDSFSSLFGSSASLLLVLLKSHTVMLCPYEEEARESHSDAIFWARLFDKPAPLLISPPGNDQHMSDLFKFYNENPSCIITSVETCSSRVWQNKNFPSLEISQGTTLDRDRLINHIRDLGYHEVPAVTSHGELSIRGGILDIFPPQAESPLRVEFFGDEIESLRIFDIETQMSVREIYKTIISPAEAPESGPRLIDLLDDYRMIVYEPDAVRRHDKSLYEELQEKDFVTFTSLPLEGNGYRCPVNGLSGIGLLKEERKSIDEFVQRIIKLREDKFLMLVCPSLGQARRLKDLFLDNDADIPVVHDIKRISAGHHAYILIGKLSSGFSAGNNIVLAERDIFGKRPSYRPLTKSRIAGLISSIEDFKVGDYIVHIEHGIGRFLGIKKEHIEDYEGDFITIEYQGGDKLFVPLERINYIQKYHAPEGTIPKIDKLGGVSWKRTRQRVKKKIRDMAEKLIKIYAKRTASRGKAFSPDTELHREFDDFFPYEETPDQMTSINEIKRDMEQPVPMDRLLCGDVGYGKTEVVMRACFKAVYDGKQVAVLVPTTILAEQHYETFSSRFSGFPVKIDFLSRFKSRQDQKKTLKDLAEAQVDIIIGTHRLLGKDVEFANLGLLIIDEEHKFGVTHKEKIKALKSNVDVLTLSATPIPRTLHMALSGIRGMSTIETPPEDRLSVQSTVARFSPSLIKEAIEKELDRGGQVFFVHNRIRDIYEMADFISNLVPGGSIGVAHGQMREKELEQVMKDFFHGKINVLVSTAIIGSGIDIPSANTILINRADRFGLADLYQLRGRVGRSDKKAFAYFLIPGEDFITGEARKKLQAIQELGYLGAGFRLALKDLEIRGAGNLLGAEQSGHIEAVGFDMYMNMLEAAIAELKGEKVVTHKDTEIDIHINANIPDYYIENPDIRLSIYRKIATIKNIESLRNIRAELRDRFGPLPGSTENLLQIMEIRLMAGRLFIEKIQNVHGWIRILFAEDTPVKPDSLFALYKFIKPSPKFLPEGGLELDFRGKDSNNIFLELKDILNRLDRDIST